MKNDLKIFKLFGSLFGLVVLLILVYPVLTMIFYSFKEVGESGFTLENYIQIFSDSLYLDSFKNSIVVSFLSAIIGLVITGLATQTIDRYFPKVKHYFLVLANLSNNYVGVPLAFGFIVLLGHSGLLIVASQRLGVNLLANFDLYSVLGLLLVFIYFQFPLGIALLLPIFDNLNREIREASELLGATSWQYWLHIGLPIVFPSLIGIFCIMFANAMGAYDTAIALTGTSINLLSVRIADTVSGDLFAQPEIGCALAVVLAIILGINMFIGSRISQLTGGSIE